LLLLLFEFPLLIAFPPTQRPPRPSPATILPSPLSSPSGLSPSPPSLTLHVYWRSSSTFATVVVATFKYKASISTVVRITLDSISDVDRIALASARGWKKCPLKVRNCWFVV
jgi:hypothetical protein